MSETTSRNGERESTGNSDLDGVETAPTRNTRSGHSPKTVEADMGSHSNNGDPSNEPDASDPQRGVPK